MLVAISLYIGACLKEKASDIQEMKADVLLVYVDHADLGVYTAVVDLVIGQIQKGQYIECFKEKGDAELIQLQVLRIELSGQEIEEVQAGQMARLSLRAAKPSDHFDGGYHLSQSSIQRFENAKN